MKLHMSSVVVFAFCLHVCKSSCTVHLPTSHNSRPHVLYATAAAAPLLLQIAAAAGS